MKTEPCKYATYYLDEKGEVAAVACSRLKALVGYEVSVHPGWCALHEEAGGADADLEKNGRLAVWIRHSMKARMMAGDMPRYPDPTFDLMALAGKLKARCAKEELKALWAEIVARWSEIPPTEGGDPVEDIERKAMDVARVWEIEGEVDEMVKKLGQDI